MIRLSRAEFERAVAEALERIPPHLRRYLDNVVVEVRERPDRSLAVHFDDGEVPDDLLGLYVGCTLPERGPAADASPLPDRILIFRRNLQAMCRTREELIDEIRITVLHEVGHHFGLDEDELAELGYD